MAPKDKNIDEDEIEDEVPYEFANRAAFFKEWYGADTDEELNDAIESDDYD